MSSFKDLLSRKKIVIANKFKVLRKIGEGSFGEVFLGVDMESNEEVAIKTEPIEEQDLLYESEVYKTLNGGEGIPQIKWYGTEKNHNILVMDLLGPSLKAIFIFCSSKLSMKTVLMLADQIIQRMEYIHSKGIIHRDIKPSNFVMGVGWNCNKLYVIDFGIAKKYREGTCARVDEDYKVGTAPYASIHTHHGIEQSRRDDMESIGYVLIYLNRGSLPWYGLKSLTEKQMFERVGEVKMSTPVDVLCNGLPDEFAMYINYCRGLDFDQPPDYMYLRQLFRLLFRRMRYEYDNRFDWVLMRPQVKAKKARAAQQPPAPQPSAQQPSAQQPSAQQPSAQQPSAPQPSAPHPPAIEIIVISSDEES